METFGELKSQVSEVMAKLKNSIDTHDFIECKVKDSDIVFSPGITWDDLMDVPSDIPMQKIVHKTSMGQNFLPVKAVSAEGKIILIVKPLDT